MEDSNPELESFRQQWRAEVSAKAQAERRKAPVTRNIPSSSRPRGEHSSNNDGADERAGGSSHPESENHDPENTGKTVSREPRSALEHYEQAVEMENQGKLTDSLNLYRKAFRVSQYSS